VTVMATAVTTTQAMVENDDVATVMENAKMATSTT